MRLKTAFSASLPPGIYISERGKKERQKKTQTKTEAGKALGIPWESIRGLRLGTTHCTSESCPGEGSSHPREQMLGEGGLLPGSLLGCRGGGGHREGFPLGCVGRGHAAAACVIPWERSTVMGGLCTGSGGSKVWQELPAGRSQVADSSPGVAAPGPRDARRGSGACPSPRPAPAAPPEGAARGERIAG